MIVSASRRTDIPAFFGEWFIKRIEDGYFVSINPFNSGQRKRISLAPDDVDCFVFWSKNPRPFIKYLKEIENFPFYFQFTLNNYPSYLEPNLPSFSKRIDTFLKLSDMIGCDRVVLRYDPVIVSDQTDYGFHLENLEQILSLLKGYTKRAVLSFVTPYKKISKKFADLERTHSLGLKTPVHEDVRDFAKNLINLQDVYNIEITACCDLNLLKAGIGKGACIDGELINTLLKNKKVFKKDKSQREGCMCVKSVDMGVYNTCSFDCTYCYANLKRETVLKNLKRYSMRNDTLIG